MSKNKIIKIIILSFLLALLLFFLLQKIDLTTADIGRFIKNGEALLKGEYGVLKTNFYSYAHPDYPFLNHHWASGLIFYIIFKIGNFGGLHLFFIILSLITFLIFFRITEKESGFKTAFILSLILIPLVGYRDEIRPELFSYFFSAIFFWILWYNRKNSLSFKWLFILPIIQILWVNIHIYFFLGLSIVGAFLLEKIIFSIKNKVYKFKNLLLIFFLCLIATLINPFGLKGAIHPFNVYGNYGYRVLEEQSVWFLKGIGITNPNFTLFKIVLFLLVLSFVLVLIKNHKKFSLVNLFLSIGFGLMAVLAIRNFTIFGFFALPIIGINIKNVLPKKENWFWIAALIIIVFTLFNNYKFLPYRWHEFGLGLVPNNNESAEFFKEKNIKGPILNNYDIGGYLIYHLYPQEKVFVDNRPETYPVSFFKETYIPMQENESIWQEKNKEYNFNTIFFSHRDATPWAQNFLIERIDDPEWTPVFADQYAIIFLKRNEINQSIIEKYEIPRNRFRVIKK